MQNIGRPKKHLVAPAFRTGTSQNFAFASGLWKGYRYTGVLDDEANLSSGKLVNGLLQWEWDMPDIGEVGYILWRTTGYTSYQEQQKITVFGITEK